MFIDEEQRDQTEVKMTQDEIKKILEAHKKWLKKEEGGKRADFSYKNLDGIELREADLRYAIFRGASLYRADLSGADLSGADLSGADLSGATLCEVILRNAVLRNVDLREAVMYNAELCNADLRESVLRESVLRGSYLNEAILCNTYLDNADFRYVDLRNADLRNANLRNADFRYVDLCHADLRNADLRNADFRRANLNFAKLDGIRIDYHTAGIHPAPEGDLIGWGKKNGIIVKLRIPADARRSCATTRKFRAEYADVLEVFGANIAVVENEYGTTVYRPGERVYAHEWDDNRWNECAGGIHFFLTREEAEAW